MDAAEPQLDAVEVLGKINDALVADGDDAEVLTAILHLTCGVLGFDRGSLIAHIDGADHAFVIAASDAEPPARFTLAISEYPELVHAMRSGAPLFIDDAATHPITAALAGVLAARQVVGIVVFPVQWRGRSLGALLLRKHTRGVPEPHRVDVLGKLIASILAAHLRNGATMESLRDKTHRISRTRYEAERRLRGIESLKEHFEAGADGVIVVDDTGRILFVNRAAERITGFARDGLVGTELAALLPLEQRTQVAEAITRVLAGVNADAFDLQLSTTSGSPVWVSASTSTVLAGTGAVILAFRDVTAERALEHELRSTTVFLERLIDSTVDAIIAADLEGRIMLFNQGAERLFGYRARDVIGKMPAWALYEDDGARQIMRMLRSTSYGGVGRLEQTRREVKIATGEVVPVTMTASVLYEGDVEVATVGILTDLRERIRMEQRLLDAQQKLQVTEKQAVVAELAAGAAHELNQPLTSIIGYAQLIQRQSAPDAQHLRAVKVILEQAERMADIVKRIGRITKYETTEYVGSAKMIDIDRSTRELEPLVIEPPEPTEPGRGVAGSARADRAADADDAADDDATNVAGDVVDRSSEPTVDRTVGRPSAPELAEDGRTVELRAVAPAVHVAPAASAAPPVAAAAHPDDDDAPEIEIERGTDPDPVAELTDDLTADLAASPPRQNDLVDLADRTLGERPGDKP